MQDGQLSNTLFEEQLNQSDWGKFQPGTGVLNPDPIAPKTSTKMSVEQLTNSLLIQGDMVNKQSQKLTSPYKETQISPLILDLTGRYNKQVVGADNEDLWAQTQTTWDKIGNGVLKGLSLAGTTFLQGTLGLVFGVAEAIGQGKLSGLYDNDFSNALNDFNTSLENSLPNYYSARERAADWWEPANIFTANFLWDKLVKNLGFSIGAIYSGAVVTKMLQLVPEAFALSKAGILSKAANSMESKLSTVPSLQRASVATNEILATSRTINTLSKTFSPTERFVISTLGAATEGGIEALQGVNEWRDSKIQEYKDQYNTIPTGEALAKIDTMAQDLGNARFGMNMALLSATNYVQLPRILSSSYKQSKLVANGVERTLSPIKKNVEKGLYESALPSTAIGKSIFRARNIAGLFLSPTESFEEISQYAAQKSVDDYYNKAYKGEGRDWLNSIAEGYSRALSDKEGLESGLLGAVSGGVQQAGFISKKGIGKTGAIGERGVTGFGGERATATADFLTKLNSTKLTMKSDGWLEEMSKSAARGINLQIEGENYIRQGDVLESKDNEFDYQHNYLTPRIKYGRYDLVKDDINTYRQLAASPEGWRKLSEMGVVHPTDTQSTFQTRLANFERHADAVNSLYQSLNVRYGGIKNKDNSIKYSSESIDKMVYAAAKISDYDTRIPQVNASLSLHGIATQDVLDSIITHNRVPEAGTKDALAQIEALNVPLDTKDQLKSDLRDLIELSLRRKNFIKDYDQLKENPEKYTPTPKEEGDKTATINKKIVELGKTYSLEDPLLREGNKLAISPTLTVLSTTLGGELEIKAPTGERTFRKPSQLPYALKDEDTTDEQYDAIAEKAIDKIIGKKPELTSLDEKLDFINDTNNKDLTDRVEAQIIADTKGYVEEQKNIKEANEKMAKDAALQKKLQEEQDALDKKAGILTENEPTEEQLASSDVQPKAPLPAFLSKEADFYNPASPKPHQQRRLKFLSSFPTFSQKKAAKINVLAVSASNEASLGLTGLIQWVKTDLQNTKMEEEQRDFYFNKDGTLKASQEPIVKLYVTNTKDGPRPVDASGNIIENILSLVISDGIFGVFHSDVDGTYKFGARQGQSNWSGEYTQEQFEEVQSKHKVWRDMVLTSTTAPSYPILSASKGIVLRDDINKPVTDTDLVTEEDLLTKEKLITIPTIERQISVGDVSYNYPIGIPLLTNGANIDFLNNRTFTKEEATTIYNLLFKRVQESNTPLAQRIENFLSSIIYMRSPRVGEEYGNSQVFHARTTLNRQYFFGTELVVDFNTHAFEAKKEQIIDYFSSYFVKTNNKILTEASATGYEEAYIDSKGEPAFRQHPSYQYFLLSTKANKTPFLQTKARKSVSLQDPSIIHRYTTLQSSEFAFTPKAKPIAKTEVPAPRTEATKKGLFGARTGPKKEAAPISYPQFKQIDVTVGDTITKQWAAYYLDDKGQVAVVYAPTKEQAENKIPNKQQKPVTAPAEADIERRRQTTNDTFYLERDRKAGNTKYYEYYIKPDGTTEAVYGANESVVRHRINAKYDAELAALKQQSVTPAKSVDEQITSILEQRTKAINDVFQPITPIDVDALNDLIKKHPKRVALKRDRLKAKKALDDLEKLINCIHGKL